jgi:hypothetical protein
MTVKNSSDSNRLMWGDIENVSKVIIFGHEVLMM